MENEIQEAYNLLRSYSYKLTGNKPDADDLFQDTMVCICRYFEKFEQGSNFKSWSTTIMYNQFVNKYRKKKSRKTYLVNTSEIYTLERFNIHLRPDGLSALHYEELLEMVNTLSENLKYPFWLAFMGYKYAEIAEKIDVPIGTIKSRIFLARKQLQNTYLNNNRLLAVA